jgi:hypothetical protein
MNHFSGMAMTKQLQAEDQREGSRRRQMSSSLKARRVLRLSGLLGIRSGGRQAAPDGQRSWRLSRS